jgi:translation initiation factor eIF-2B subunit delta
MVAKYYNCPCLVFCPTSKFSEKSQLDSLTRNEISDVTKLKHIDNELKENEFLTIINLYYDVTPLEHIDMVITEFGKIPPTSTQVILREYSGSKNDKEKEIFSI